MELIKPKIKDFPGRHIELTVDKPELDFEDAKHLAKQKAKEFCFLLCQMLCVWQSKKQKSFAKIRCCCPGTKEKPANGIRI